MTLAFSDWLIIAAYFVLSLLLGLRFAGRAGRSLAEYFVSGRSLPWWLAGTSMVATTFAADTPLAVTGLVVKYGVAGNWLWWNGALSGLLTVFFFARLWRRAGVLTDVEFVELRYGGKPAAALRGVRALYLALPINLIIMGWVTRAMATILEVSFGISGWQVTVVLFGITAGYSILSGLWGVIWTDFFQFIVAMGGSITLAALAVNRVGGLDRLVDLAGARYGSHDAALGILPPLGGGAWLPLSSLLVFLAVQWWAAWYPGAEPGGGGYVAQRILSSKDQRHGLLATLWFNIAHYALRPWPWILVALFAAVTYPDLANPEEGYVRAMVDLLPSPLKGLLLAALAAAYMSTISTHLNWGTSYLVNDIYIRFIDKGRGLGVTGEYRPLTRESRIATVVMMVLALVVMQFLGSVEAGWRFLLAIGAGTGSVLILRWYWWRINAWSELVAMAASFVTALSLQASGFSATDPTGGGYAAVMLITVGVTTIAWVVATFLTRPENDETLERFYRRVRPGGPGWRAVAVRLGFGADRIPGGALSWVNWAAGWLAVYGTLFGIGQLLVGTFAGALALLAAAAGLFAVIARNLRKDQGFRAGTVDSARATL